MHYRNLLIERLQTATFQEALAIIDELIQEAQDDLKALKSKRSQIESLIDLNSPDQGSKSKSGFEKLPIPERVIELLKREGELTWKELYSHMPDVRPGTVYAAVRGKLAEVEIVKVGGKLDTLKLKASTAEDHTGSGS